MLLLDRLRSLKDPIRVGIIGAGVMGKGVLHQVNRTPGMVAVAFADLDIGKATRAAESLGMETVQVGSSRRLAEEIGNGQALPICAEGLLVSSCSQVDVVIECTTAIMAGAEFVLTALEDGKVVVLMNSEIDLSFGPLFQQVAAENETVCTSIDGDQYGVITRLMRDIELWGMTVVMAGNIKGFLDREATPTSIEFEARKRNLDPVTCAAMTDGTKVNIEMALLCNAHGLYTDVPGMHGPRAERVEDVLDVFELDKMWRCECADGILDTQASVDYILGAEPGGGVFVVAYEQDDYQRQMMRYYKMGDGPYYVLYRPWHICHIEAMGAVAEAYLDGTVLMAPWQGHMTEVYAHAKRDLKAGETLDGIGGETCYGMIHNCHGNWRRAGLPIALADGVKLKTNRTKGELIRVDEVDESPNAATFRLYDRSRGSGG